MDFLAEQHQNERKDRIKSAVITTLVSALALLVLIFYQITQSIPKKQEKVTTMLINFGDGRNGKGAEEPANQEGSLASKVEQEPEKTQPKEEAINKTEVIAPVPKTTSKPKEKVLTTAKESKFSAPKAEDSKSTPKASKSSHSEKSSTANSTVGKGDGKGTAAIGNLIKGKGSKPGSQGDGSGIGNNGDPLGGTGNGDSKIGIDRKLVSYIPGTMGRGGKQPAHSCSTTGSITISYVVDRSGNVVSAKRSGGVSDPCVVSTSVAWVKQYVKAEKGSSSSSGTYKITF